jgi:DNA polymerase III subunit alpha, Gram-positive type
MFIFTYLFKYIYQTLFGYGEKEKEETIYFDLETTGLNPYHDKIIEFAFIYENYDEHLSADFDEHNYINRIKENNNKLYGSDDYITALINPETKFDRKITNITNIHPDQLEDKSNITEMMPTIESFINYSFNTTKKDINSYLIAHNCDSFDKLFIKNAIKTYEKNTDNKINCTNWYYIDTLLLAKKLYPNLFSYSLKNLSNIFKIKEGDHRALNDTSCLQKIYHKMLDKLAIELKMSFDTLINNPSLVYDYIYN